MVLYDSVLFISREMEGRRKKKKGMEGWREKVEGREGKSDKLAKETVFLQGRGRLNSMQSLKDK